MEEKNPTSGDSSNPSVNQTASENSTLVNATHSQVTLTNHYHYHDSAPAEVADKPRAKGSHISHKKY